MQVQKRLYLTLTLDFDGSSCNSFSQVVRGTAHIDSFIIRTHSSDVQGNIAKVMSAVDAGTCNTNDLGSSTIM